MEGGVGYIRCGWREVLATLDVDGERCWLHQRWVEGGVGYIRGGWREVLATLEVGGGRCWLH